MDFQNQNDLQVEKILDKKVFNGKTLYLVKWKNYPIEEATWECNKLLANVKDKIRDFKYSKRAIQQIPNIKLQEDFPEGQIRDTFKRKRGRPPRLSFNSYRSAAYQSTQKNSTFNQTQQNVIKRGRGRPRGSKNKRPRHVHFEEQSSATFDSEEYEKSRIMQKTITNDDSSINESDQNGNKKLKKLKKMILKTQNLQMKDEKQKQFDIVDSQDQISQQQLNLSLGQKPNNKCSFIESKDNYTQPNEKTINQKGKQNCQLTKLKQISINREESIEQDELQSKLAYFRGQQHQNQKQKTKQKQTKNFGTLSSQQEFRRIFGKKNNKKQNILHKQLDSFEKKYFNQNNQQEKVPQPLFEDLKPSKTTEKLAEQQKSQTSKEKYTQVKENITKKPTQVQLVLNSKIDNRQNLSKASVNNIQKITKIYHLQTIKLPLYNKIDEFINDKFEQFSYGQFSEQQLKKMSLTKKIVQILNNSTNFKRLQLNSKVDQNKFINKSRIVYDILCKNLKNNPQKDNHEQIDQLRQTLLSNKFENQILELRNGMVESEVQEILYLVQFNQGQIIKKMTASDLALYLIVDMIKSSGISCSDQCLGLILNFTFYLKFLEKSLLPFGIKNQSQTKIEKNSVRNIKLEDKDLNKKSQLQDLLIEALNNVKNQPNHNNLDSSRLNKPIKNIDSAYQNKRKSSIFSQNQQLFPCTKNSEKTAKYEEGSMGQKF